MNEAETLFEIHLQENMLFYQREVCLVRGRRLRWDFIVNRLAIEIQGGIWMRKGGHNTGKGIKKDIEKSRAAIIAGYTPVSFMSEEVLNGSAILWILDYLDLMSEEVLRTR